MELIELLLRRRARVGAILAALVALVAFTALRGGTEDTPEYLEPRVEPEPSLAERVPYDGRSPRLAQSGDLRVLAELPRPALGARRDLAKLNARERRDYVANLRDESRSLRSALEAKGVRLRDVTTFERAWNGFAATIRERDLGEFSSLGVRTRPIRRFFPAISEPVPDPAALEPPVTEPSGGSVALLAGGAPGKGGYDAVDTDSDAAPGADPRDVSRPEVSGTALARVLEDLGARVVPVRVASLRPTPQGTEEHARTDELLAGLEYAVDPDRDGNPADHTAVALIGVNAPYAGFDGAPEAEAAGAAAALGTVVVAAAGHEGPGTGPYGTVGSPAAAEGAVTVGALAAPGPPARLELKVGGLRMRGAALLGGTPFGEPLRSGTAAGEVAVVEAGEQPSASAMRAAAAGAAAVVLAESRPERPLTAMPAGLVGVPVIGVTGAAAKALLELPPGLEVSITAYESTAPGDPGRVAALSSSTGPTYAGAAKPDWLAQATAAGVAGTGVAAARVAAALARTPGADPQGAVRPQKADRAPRARPVPIGKPAVEREKKRVTGVRFTVGAFERGDPVTGKGTMVAPAERLELTLESATDRVVRRLTPPGGEQGLLPGEYRYTLPGGVLEDLEAGSYRFVVRARGPRQRRPTVIRSPAFEVS